MDEIIFLTLDEVLRIHSHAVERYGGSEGLRDIGLLESAIAQPQGTFGGQYLHPEVAQMAAAYLFHIVSNHPFVDGNKRTGLAAAIVFLEINMIVYEADQAGAEELTLRVAKGEADTDDIAAWFRERIDPS